MTLHLYIKSRVNLSNSHLTSDVLDLHITSMITMGDPCVFFQVKKPNVFTGVFIM